MQKWWFNTFGFCITAEIQMINNNVEMVLELEKLGVRSNKEESMRPSYVDRRNLKSLNPKP